MQPLTFPQRELWEASPIPVADVSNHICTFIEVRGLLTTEDCDAGDATSGRPAGSDAAFYIARQGSAGPDDPREQPAQDAVPELSSVSERRPEAIEELMQETFSEPFDLVQGPLYRVNVLRRGADDHLLVLTIHHAIADGWTLGAFVQDSVCRLCTRGSR